MSPNVEDLKLKIVAALNKAHRKNDTDYCQELSSSAERAAVLSDTAYEAYDYKPSATPVANALIVVGYEPVAGEVDFYDTVFDADILAGEMMRVMIDAANAREAAATEWLNKRISQLEAQLSAEQPRMIDTIVARGVPFSVDYDPVRGNLIITELPASKS